MPMPLKKKYTADEFLKMELPERCELINGEIYIGEESEKYDPNAGRTVSLSAPNQLHQRISRELLFSITDYIRRNKGGCEAFNAPSDVKLDDSTIVQPDIFVTCRPDRLDGQFHNGAPDWIIEILSPSTLRKDFSIKLSLYKSHGVREYWIVDPIDSRVIFYWFENGGITELYTFSDHIPVHIYKNAEPPLTIRLADNL
ncbi:MAG: Uma2 family endonuclease [Oscillospiraceae bacterium]|nr:Uma2 family endonuclease [Oscillospiraceae bacterium]